MQHHRAIAAGRTAVITGSASGIGLAAGQRLARRLRAGNTPALSCMVAMPQQLRPLPTPADTDGLGALHYSWQSSTNGSSWTDIAGATADRLTLGEAEVGLRLRVVVRYTDDGGSAESATSAATAAVANVDDDPTGTVTLSGATRQGRAGVGLRCAAPAFSGERGRFTRLNDPGPGRLRTMAASICRQQTGCSSLRRSRP